MTTQYFSLGDVSRLLDVQPHRITYLLATRQVGEPSLRIGNKRVFTANDVAVIAAALKVELARELQVKQKGQA